MSIFDLNTDGATEPNRGRRLFCGALLAGSCAALAGRAAQLQFAPSALIESHEKKSLLQTLFLPAARGSLLDRHGMPLAVSTPVDSVWADPFRFVHDRQTIAELASLLEFDPENLERLLRRDRRFVWLRRRLGPGLRQRLGLDRFAGIHTLREYRRYYPEGEAAAQLVGRTDVDEKGRQGLELVFDKELAGHDGRVRLVRDLAGRAVGYDEFIAEARPGSDVRLSISRNLQNQSYRYLIETVAREKARAGAAIVMEPASGEILAMVSSPSYNPNSLARASAQGMRARALTDVWEPGSTIKPLIVAAALESGQWRLSSRIRTPPGGFRVGSHQISDHRDLGEIDLSEVIIKSSNVAAAKIALSLPAEDIWRMLDRFGWGRHPNSGFPGEATGRLPYAHWWRRLDRAVIGYGYGVSVSLLQLVRAYAAIANDGILPGVRFADNQDAVKGVRVLAPEISAQLKTALSRVTERGGTGWRARVPGFRVAGKTGTTRKFKEGSGYSDERHLAFFVGFVPVENPRFAIAVAIDEPRAGALYGGQVAAPLFSRIASYAMRYHSGGEPIPAPADRGGAALVMAAASPRDKAPAMKASELLQIPLPCGDFAVPGLSLDSRRTRPGELFFAVRGAGRHGLDFVAGAVDRGAAAVVVDAEDARARELLQSPRPAGQPPLLAMPQLRVGEIAARFYGRPSASLRVVGVSGTDGKTTVAHTLASLFEALGRPCGLIGTLGASMVSARQPPRQGLTTPNPIEVQSLLADFLAAGAVCAVLEATSHGLDQGRLAGVDFTLVVLTNISSDHLDYHGSQEAYAAAKESLLRWPGVQTAVVNLDDETVCALARRHSQLNLIGFAAAGPGNAPDLPVAKCWWAEDSSCRRDGIGFTLVRRERGRESRWQLASPMIGQFNILNLLAAVAAAEALGLEPEKIAAAAGGVLPPAGRMESFGGGAGQPLVVVDYAHTAAALENALQALRPLCRGRLWCLFGCGGDRDRGKRPLMGAAAERLADRVFLCDDNPRTEEPQQILNDIVRGMNVPEGAHLRSNRTAALAEILAEAAPEDVILVAGKGHETHTLVKGRRLESDDRARVRILLEGSS